MKTWRLNKEIKDIKSLPIIALWFIWNAINLSFFEDTILLPSQVAIFNLGLLKFPQDNLAVKIRIIAAEIIDKSYPWGYFDASAASDLCGSGGMIFFLLLMSTMFLLKLA